MIKQLLMTAVMTGLITGCASDRMVIAEFAGQKLHYQEIRESIKIYKTNTYNYTPEMLQNFITDTVIMPKLIARQMMDDYRDNPLFQMNMKSSEYSVALKMMQDEGVRDFKLDTRLYKIRSVFLRFPENGTPADEEPVRLQAESLLEHLKQAPWDFYDTAMKYSHDSMSLYGGESHYFTLLTIDPVLADVIRGLKLKEMTSRPVRTNIGMHIIQLLETVAVDEWNIKNYIRDDSEYQLAVNAEQYYAGIRRVESFRSRYPVEIHMENLKTADSRAVILKIGNGYQADLAYLQYRLMQSGLTGNEVFKMNYQLKIPENVTEENIRYFIEHTLIPEGLAYNEVVRLKINTQIDYQILLDQFRNEFLQQVFRHSVDFSVTEPDEITLRTYYETHKEQEFFDYRYMNQTGIRRIVPYEKVEAVIRSKLKMLEFDKKLQERRDEIKKKYPVKFYLNRIVK